MLCLAGPPLVWLVAQKPVAMVVLFSVFASCITPAIAALLFYLNNKVAWVVRARYGALANTVLGTALILFLYLMGRTLVRLF